MKHQNVALGKEMAKAKNQLSELRIEMDRVQKEKRSMESLVAVIDRSWSQVIGEIYKSFIIKETNSTKFIFS